MFERNRSDTGVHRSADLAAHKDIQRRRRNVRNFQRYGQDNDVAGAVVPAFVEQATAVNHGNIGQAELLLWWCPGRLALLRARPTAAGLQGRFIGEHHCAIVRLASANPAYALRQVVVANALEVRPAMAGTYIHSQTAHTLSTL